MSNALRPEALPKGYEWVAGLVAKPGSDFEIKTGKPEQQGYEKGIVVVAKNRRRTLKIDFTDTNSLIQVEGTFNNQTDKWNSLAITSRGGVSSLDKSTDLLMHSFELVPHLSGIQLGYFSEDRDGVAKLKTLNQIRPTQQQLEMIFASPIPNEHTVGTIAHLLLMGQIEKLSKALDYKLTFDPTRNAHNPDHSWVFMKNWEPAYKAGDTLSAIALMGWNSGENEGSPHTVDVTIGSNEVIGVEGDISIDGSQPRPFIKAYDTLGISQEDARRDSTLLVARLFKVSHTISST